MLATTSKTNNMHALQKKEQIKKRIKKQKIKEKIIEKILLSLALVSIVATLSILYLLISQTFKFFSNVPIWNFLTDTQWTPLFSEAHFGVLVLLSATLTSSIIALIIALPIGTAIAIYLSEFASTRSREIIKPLLELLSSIPTIIYGYFALMTVTPFLQALIPNLQSFNLLSAGLVMGIMIIPYVSSLSEDAMRAVPMGLKEASYSLGAGRLKTSLNVVFPTALPGIAAAYILGISRALGETMILAVAAGMQPNLTFNPLEPASSITAFIVQIALGDLRYDSIGYQAIFTLGLVLVFITLCFNLLGQRLCRKYKKLI